MKRKRRNKRKHRQRKEKARQERDQENTAYYCPGQLRPGQYRVMMSFREYRLFRPFRPLPARSVSFNLEGKTEIVEIKLRVDLRDIGTVRHAIQEITRFERVPRDRQITRLVEDHNGRRTKLPEFKRFLEDHISENARLNRGHLDQILGSHVGILKENLQLQQDGTILVKGLQHQEEKFEEMRELFGLNEWPDHSAKLYHGTQPKNIASILREGFRPSRGGALGPGIYFGKPQKAHNFVERLPWFSSYHNRSMILIEAEVLLGNPLDAYHTGDYSKGIPGDEYQSVYGRCFFQPEWAVFDPTQILITRLIPY